MDTTSSLAIIIFAAVIHASFQLSVSVLTLMSGHAIGAKRSHAKLLRLTGSFLFGAGVMTMLLLSFTALVAGSLFGSNVSALVWTISCGLLVGLGISVWLFYYRRANGTTLWLPRNMASFLAERSKHTKNTGEAFGLGLSSVIAETLFLLGPVLVSALALIHLAPKWQLVGILVYTLISLLSLLIVGSLVGSGHTLGGIQKWRESNKHFLQFAAGTGLLVLGFYIYVEQVLTATVTATGGV
jgi:hypothetical protein